VFLFGPSIDLSRGLGGTGRSSRREIITKLLPCPRPQRYISTNSKVEPWGHSTQTLAAISASHRDRQAGDAPPRGLLRACQTPLDKQKIVVPEVFAGHIFDAEDAFLLCHGVQPSARILSCGARDESGSGQAAGLGASSRRPSSSDRLALTARPASRTNGTSANGLPSTRATYGISQHLHFHPAAFTRAPGGP